MTYPIPEIPANSPVNKPGTEWLNYIARVLNKLSGVNCTIERNGDEWLVNVDMPEGNEGMASHSDGTEDMVLTSTGVSAPVWQFVRPENCAGESGGEVVAFGYGSTDETALIPMATDEDISGTPYFKGYTAAQMLGEAVPVASGYSKEDGYILRMEEGATDVAEWANPGVFVGQDLTADGEKAEGMFLTLRDVPEVGWYGQWVVNPSVLPYEGSPGGAGYIPIWMADGTLGQDLLSAHVAVSDGVGASSATQFTMPVFLHETDFDFDCYTPTRILELFVDKKAEGDPGEDAYAEPWMMVTSEVEIGGEPSYTTQWQRLFSETFDGTEDEQLVALSLSGSGSAIDPYVVSLSKSGYTAQDILDEVGAGWQKGSGTTFQGVAYYDAEGKLSISSVRTLSAIVITTDARMTDQRGWDVTGGISSASGGRTALELGNSATLNTGSTAGTVAVGNHDHDGTYALISGSIVAGRLATWDSTSSITDTDFAAKHVPFADADASGLYSYRTLPFFNDSSSPYGYRYTCKDMNYLVQQVAYGTAGAFNATQSSTNYMPVYLRWTGSAFEWDDICDSATCDNDHIVVWENDGNEARLVTSAIAIADVLSTSDIGTGAEQVAAGNHTHSNVSSSAAGFCPTHPNNAGYYLRGDGTWAAEEWYDTTYITQNFWGKGTGSNTGGICYLSASNVISVSDTDAADVITWYGSPSDNYVTRKKSGANTLEAAFAVKGAGDTTWSTSDGNLATCGYLNYHLAPAITIPTPSGQYKVLQVNGSNQWTLDYVRAHS